MHKLIKAFAFGIWASMAAMPAAAQLTVTPGNNPQPNDANLLSTGGSGNPVTLVTNVTGFQVTVQGTENLVTPTAGLQATVAASDGAFSTLTFSLADPNSTFTSLILNLDSSQDGTVSFTDAAGTVGQFALDDNAQNFFTLTGGPFTFISFTTFVAGIETPILTDVSSMRLGGVTTSNNPPGVPEPGTWSFMLLGFGIAGLALRKNKPAHARIAIS